MNIRDANAEDIISFVRNHIEARHDRTTYTTIKNQCLQIYTEKSFQHHKFASEPTIVEHGCKTGQKIQNLSSPASFFCSSIKTVQNSKNGE